MNQVNILCEKFPDNINYQAQRGSELMQNGEHEKAIDLFNDLIKMNPYNFSSFTSRGHAQKTLGKTDEAIESYRSAFNIKPDHGEAFFSLSNLKTYTFTKNELNVMRQQLKRVDLTLKDKAYFHFALAQGCEVVGKYDEAFFHLDSGNKIKNKQSK